MKATQTWSFAGLLLLAGMASVSCGKDEGTNGGGGSGTILTGGTGGTGAGTAGTRAMGGTAGSNPAATATRLGRACVAAADCMDANAPKLTCITSKDAVLGDGAPPKGLCTQECTLPTMADPTDECAALGTDAVCFPFSSDQNATTGYCVEGCSFGKPDIGEAKCHTRPEFACNPAFLGATTTPCTTTADDCQDGEICSQGFCDVVFPACLPSCRGDVDCEPGMYCDQSFLSGVCVKTKPVGKLLGEPCTVNAADQPDEPDDCVGYCAPDDTGSTKGHCSATCTLGAPCAFDPAAKVFDGACLYLSAITGQTAAAGDFGFCTPTCDCAAECNDPALGCELSPQGKLSTQYRAAGLCFPPSAMSMTYDQCTGAGGSPDPGAAGSPGVAGNGAGGAP